MYTTIFYTRDVPVFPSPFFFPPFPGFCAPRRTKTQMSAFFVDGLYVRSICRTFRVVCCFIATFRKRFGFHRLSAGKRIFRVEPFVIIRRRDTPASRVAFDYDRESVILSANDGSSRVYLNKCTIHFCAPTVVTSLPFSSTLIHRSS